MLQDGIISAASARRLGHGVVGLVPAAAACLGARAVALLTLGFMVSTVIGENLLYPLISISVADIFHIVSIAVRLALLMVLILVVYLGNSPPGCGGLAGAAGRGPAHCFAIYL